MATLAELQARKAKYQAAIDVILDSMAQKYSNRAGGEVERPQLDFLEKQLAIIETQIQALQSGGSCFVADITGGGY